MKKTIFLLITATLAICAPFSYATNVSKAKNGNRNGRRPQRKSVDILRRQLQGK